MDKITLVCENGGERLDKFVKIDSLTRSAVQKLIEDGRVTVNGETERVSYKVCTGDVVEVSDFEPKNLTLNPKTFRSTLCMRTTSFWW